MQITIPGKPIPKKSVRTSKGRSYNPNKKEMDVVKLLVKSQVKHEPITGAVYLKATFYMPIPKSRRKDGTRDGDPHSIKPDRDNLEKFIYDCMSGIVFKDDCQIADGPVRKIYSDNPRTEIEYCKL